MSDFILYNYFRSSASYRVRIGLALKGVEYEYRPVHLIKNGGEQKQDEYVALNPSAEVPTLVHKGRPMAQSMAILQYLDEIAPEGPALFPKDPFQRALVVQVCEIVNSGAQPLGNLRVLAELESRFGADAAGKAAWSSYWIDYGLRTLEAFLTKTASSFCFGNEPCAADAFLVPHAYNAYRHKVSVDPYPLVAKIYKNCLELEAFSRARPGAQPDTPPELRD